MSSQTLNFRDKVQQLEHELAKCNKNIDGGDSCFPLIYIAAASVPVIFFLALHFLSPGFVKVKEGSKLKRSWKRVLMYSTLLTAIVWASMYGYTKYTAK